MALPTVAPAANRYICDVILPWVKHIFATVVFPCGLIKLIYDEYATVLDITNHLQSGPPPASQAEQQVHAFWKAFIFDLDGFPGAMSCHKATSQYVKDQTCGAPNPELFSYFASWTYCFGPHNTIKEANDPLNYVYCVECFNGVPVGIIGVPGAVLIDNLVTVTDLQGLQQNASAICITDDPDFPEPCCGELKNILNSILNSLKGL